MTRLASGEVRGQTRSCKRGTAGIAIFDRAVHRDGGGYFRAVRAALLLSQAGGIRSIVVTSCLPAEGKTSTVLNLAVVLAQLDKRVLLVDADLHKPRLHDTLRIPNRIGLVSILVENVSPTLAIQTTQIPGVSVVVSGPPTPNPSGLLSSDSMRTLLEFAEMNFDYVLIDSPPLESVADAMLIGSQTDGVVLCVEGGSTSRDRVARIRNMLAKSNVPVRVKIALSAFWGMFARTPASSWSVLASR